MEHPCEHCKIRKGYAKAFDFHFYGEDCPYVCDEYELWKVSDDQLEEDDEVD